jgi:hypothetical protein
MRVVAVGFAVTFANTPSFDDPPPTGPDGFCCPKPTLATTPCGSTVVAARLNQFPRGAWTDSKVGTKPFELPMLFGNALEEGGGGEPGGG